MSCLRSQLPSVVGATGLQLHFAALAVSLGRGPCKHEYILASQGPFSKTAIHPSPSPGPSSFRDGSCPGPADSAKRLRAVDANSLSLLALLLALSLQHPEFSRFQGGSYLSLQLLVSSEQSSIPHTPHIRETGKEPETYVAASHSGRGRNLLPPEARKASLLQQDSAATIPLNHCFSSVLPQLHILSSSSFSSLWIHTGLMRCQQKQVPRGLE